MATATTARRRAETARPVADGEGGYGPWGPAAIPRTRRAAEKLLLARCQETVVALLGDRPTVEGAAQAAELRAAIAGHVAEYGRWAAQAAGGAWQPDDPEATIGRLYDDLLGLSILQPLMDDPAVEEIICNGPMRLFVKRPLLERVRGTYFEDAGAMLVFAKRLVAMCGERLDESRPFVDGRLPDGSRLNVTIPPAAVDFPCITIRKFLLRASSLADLVALGTLPQDAADFLEAAFRARVNVLVSGSTAAGKCVTGETTVALGDGISVPIRDLVEASFAAIPSRVGDDGWESAPAVSPVLTCDFATGTIGATEEVRVWRHRAPATIFVIATRSGNTARVTPEHPFFTIADGQIVQVRADQLRPGMCIAAAAAIPTAGRVPRLLELLAADSRVYAVGDATLMREAVTRLMRQSGLIYRRDAYDLLGLGRRRIRSWEAGAGVPLANYLTLLRLAGMPLPGDEAGPATVGCQAKNGAIKVALAARPCPDLARLAGLIVGDGHLTRVCVELTSGDEAVRDEFDRLARKLFGLAPILQPPSHRCPTLRLFGTVAVEVLRVAFSIPLGTKARSVRAPGWLFAAPHELIAGYLSGLLDTDGSVLDERNSATARGSCVEFCTASCGLAGDIAALLLRLGVRSHRVLRDGRSIVRVYDRAGMARLTELLTLTHSTRAPLLANLAVPARHSNTDVIAGVGPLLRRARQDAGLTVEAFGRRENFSVSTLRAYEYGHRSPRRATLAAVAARLPESPFRAQLEAIVGQPVYWDRVTAAGAIEGHGEEYVYDLTVSGTHTFLIGDGGLVAHNTTLINALGNALDADADRAITIEETPELQLARSLPNCVALAAQGENVEGAGRITIRDLVRNALRMTPTRIIVGEVRGAEALDMLGAMNTGHDGSCCSIHANSPRQALQKLATFAMMAEERLPRPALAEIIADTVELVVQLRADHLTGARRVTQIYEVTGLEGDTIQGQELWAEGAAGGRLAPTGLAPRCLAKIAAAHISYSTPRIRD